MAFLAVTALALVFALLGLCACRQWERDIIRLESELAKAKRLSINNQAHRPECVCQKCEDWRNQGHWG